jgi:hypothetical protein
MKALQNQLKTITVLSKADPCPECLTPHIPEAPHNKYSLFYRCTFFGRYRRWPTWQDAMAHCSQETKIIWMQEMLKLYTARLRAKGLKRCVQLKLN